jgi:hypothetical protein
MITTCLFEELEVGNSHPAKAHTQNGIYTKTVTKFEKTPPPPPKGPKHSSSSNALSSTFFVTFKCLITTDILAYPVPILINTLGPWDLPGCGECGSID